MGRLLVGAEGGSFIPGGITSGSTTTSGFSAGQLPYSNGSTVQALSQGSSGQFLQSNGPGNAPTWTNASGAGSGTVTSCSQYSVGVYLATGTTINCSSYLQLNGATLEIGANGTPGSVTYWGAAVGQSTTVNASTYGGATSFVWPYSGVANDPLASAASITTLVNKTINCSNNTCQNFPVNLVAGTSTTSGYGAGQFVGSNGSSATAISVATASQVQTGTDNASPVTSYALAQSATPQTLSCASNAATWTLSGGYNAILNLGSSCTGMTLTLSGTPVAGVSYTIWVVQDSSGSRTVTNWPSVFDWGGSAPTLSTGASKIDWISCQAYSTTTLTCSYKLGF